MSADLVVGEHVCWTPPPDEALMVVQAERHAALLGPPPPSLVLYGQVLRAEGPRPWVRIGKPDGAYQWGHGCVFAAALGDLERGTWVPWTWRPA